MGSGSLAYCNVKIRTFGMEIQGLLCFPSLGNPFRRACFIVLALATTAHKIHLEISDVSTKLPGWLCSYSTSKVLASQSSQRDVQTIPTSPKLQGTCPGSLGVSVPWAVICFENLCPMAIEKGVIPSRLGNFLRDKLR